MLVVALLLSLPARADVSLPVRTDASPPVRKSAPRAREGGGGTFCEFEVFRAEDHRPMGGIRYKLKLPSGRVLRGRVPENGLVHVDVPHAGSCTIDFDLPPGMIIAD